MTEHQTGLRFDIYERVYLDEASTPIGELDEMELIPHIQVVQENEQAVLQGNLWLTGKYTGENGEESRTLEHYIPVEITLPMNRIQRLEDINVEIEAFDVDLLSAKSVNVTGVLSLHGIEMISRADETWKEEEEFHVVHQAKEPAPYVSKEVRTENSEAKSQSAESSSWSGQVQQDKEQVEDNVDSSVKTGDALFRANEHGAWGVPAGEERPAEERSAVEPDDSSDAASVADFSTEKPVPQESQSAREETPAPSVEAKQVPAENKPAENIPAVNEEPSHIEQLNVEPPNKELPKTEAANVEQPNVENQEMEAEVLAEDEESIEVVMPPDKQELKIAFKSAEPSSGYHLKNLVGKVDITEEAGEHRTEEQQAAPPPVEDSDSDPLEFRRLVSRSAGGEEQQFKRMRMCIVQKEETLETIAERYNLNPREIVLYNRLGDQQLEEGQVIYIP